MTRRLETPEHVESLAFGVVIGIAGILFAERVLQEIDKRRQRRGARAADRTAV